MSATPTATMVRRVLADFGDVRLYRLSEPLNGFEYVTVSAVDHGGRPETYIFGSDADGSNRRSSSELLGSYQGGTDHRRALELAGYTIGVTESPGDYTQARQDLVAVAETAARHVAAWQGRDIRTREGEAEAYAALVHAVGALERLASAVGALQAPLAALLEGHRTDQADAIGHLFGEVGEKREHQAVVGDDDPHAAAIAAVRAETEHRRGGAA